MEIKASINLICEFDMFVLKRSLSVNYEYTQFQICQRTIPRLLAKDLLWLQSKESWSFNVKVSPMVSEKVLRREATQDWLQVFKMLPEI